MKKAAILILILFSLNSCTQQPAPDKSSKKYFDLQAFFNAEIKNLQKKAPLIKKDIAKNDQKESKNIRIRSWANELGLFSGSDINKSAWKDSYEIKTTQTGTEYIAREPELRTRKIIIDRSKNTVKHIFILNEVDNSLFSSREELDYYPDSIYQIRKKQHIIFIGDNDYFVSGRIR